MRRLKHEENCAEALAEFTDLLIAGRAPSVEAFLLRYPDFESSLRPALEAALVLFDAFEIVRRDDGLGVDPTPDK